MLKKFFYLISFFLLSFSNIVFAAGIWTGYQVPTVGTPKQNVYDVTQQTVNGVTFLLAMTGDGLYWATSGAPPSDWQKCTGQDGVIGTPTRVFGPSNWSDNDPPSNSPYVYMTSDVITGTVGSGSGVNRFILGTGPNTCALDNATIDVPITDRNGKFYGGFVPPGLGDQWIYLLQRENTFQPGGPQDVLWVTHDGGASWTPILHPAPDPTRHFNDVFRDPTGTNTNIFVAVSGGAQPGLYYVNDPLPMSPVLAKISLAPFPDDEDLFRVYVRNRIETLEPPVTGGTEVYTGGLNGLLACFRMNAPVCTIATGWQRYTKQTNRCKTSDPNYHDLPGNIITGIFAVTGPDDTARNNSPDIQVSTLSTDGPLSVSARNKSYFDILSSFGLGAKSNKCNHKHLLNGTNAIVDGGVAFLDIADITDIDTGACSSPRSGYYTSNTYDSTLGAGPLDISSFTFGISGGRHDHGPGVNMLVGNSGPVCLEGGVNYSNNLQP